MRPCKSVRAGCAATTSSGRPISPSCGFEFIFVRCCLPAIYISLCLCLSSIFPHSISLNLWIALMIYCSYNSHVFHRASFLLLLLITALFYYSYGCRHLSTASFECRLFCSEQQPFRCSESEWLTCAGAHQLRYSHSRGN